MDSHQTCLSDWCLTIKGSEIIHW